MPFQNSGGNASGGKFFAAYSGSSMHPTLRELEIMEIRPYDRRPLRVGDVAFFLSPEEDQPVVHRVVRVTPAGIATRGDNNPREDTSLLQPKSVKGRVVAAWRGQKRRTIAGGLRGRLTSRRVRWGRVLGRGLSSRLHPFYQALSHGGVIARAVPASWRPRVVVFRVRGREQLQLLLGQRIIGRYDDLSRQWRLQRPFKLFVDGRALPRPPEKDRWNRRVLTEGQRIINQQWPLDVAYHLVLADGVHWEIAAGDEEAAPIVSQLGCVMQLRLTPSAIQPSPHGPLRRLLVQVEAQVSGADNFIPLASKNDGVVAVRILKNLGHNSGCSYLNLVRLSLIFAREAQARGGVLIHGALAERKGIGVILAAPGGTGKTTASHRLPAPWRSLCDDATLVVRDPQGKYWAHPWPTWSRILDTGSAGPWDVQNAVPVQGIFLLDQAVEDRVERVGPGHAASLLAESVGQVSALMAWDLSQKELRTLHLERFDNLCALARALPVHILHLSLTGAFWQEIEQALEGSLGAEAQEAIGKNEIKPKPPNAG